MTREKLQFLLPVVFTVGPDVNKRGGNDPTAHRDVIEANIEDAPADLGDALMKYAMLLADGGPVRQAGQNGQNRDAHIENIIKGIIEGETRVLISSMSMEEIFSGKSTAH